MVVLIQRCEAASVSVEEETVGKILHGLAVFVGFEANDPASLDEKLAAKLLALRVFPDEQGKMNKSVVEVEGGILLIPNFTLAGECEKGNRPSFSNAMPPVEARTRYEALAASLRGRITSFGAGRFGADMLVQVANDGPVSLVMRLT